MKIYDFLGDLADVTAKKKPIVWIMYQAWHRDAA